MPILVQVTYLSQPYTYEITRDDDKHFVCTRSLVQAEPANAPPERMHVVLGEEPNEAVWGESLVLLYRELSQKIRQNMTSRSSSPG